MLRISHKVSRAVDVATDYPAVMICPLHTEMGLSFRSATTPLESQEHQRQNVLGQYVLDYRYLEIKPAN